MHDVWEVEREHCCQQMTFTVLQRWSMIVDASYNQMSETFRNTLEAIVVRAGAFFRLLVRGVSLEVFRCHKRCFVPCR